MAQIVDADVGDLCLHAHPFPEPLDVIHRLARHIAGEKEGAGLGHGNTTQADQGDRFVQNRHRVDAALLGIGGLLGPDCQIEVELIEGRKTDLAAAGAGQYAGPLNGTSKATF